MKCKKWEDIYFNINHLVLKHFKTVEVYLSNDCQLDEISWKVTYNSAGDSLDTDWVIEKFEISIGELKKNKNFKEIERYIKTPFKFVDDVLIEGLLQNDFQNEDENNSNIETEFRKNLLSLAALDHLETIEG